MIIWLYCIIRNEARILPYMLRHYERFVDRLQFWDDNSTDGTREMISTHPKCELHDWPGTSAMVDDEFLAFSNSQWKEAKGVADWVIWVDADEFLYHHDILALLSRYKDIGVEIPDVEGFTMVSAGFPSSKGQIYEEVRQGFPDSRWCKRAIFNPSSNMVYTMGRHDIIPTGAKSSPQRDLFLLHYRCLGLDYLADRHARNWSRVPEHCRMHNLGENTNPAFTGPYSVSWFKFISQQKLPNII